MANTKEFISVLVSSCLVSTRTLFSPSCNRRLPLGIYEYESINNRTGQVSTLSVS